MTKKTAIKAVGLWFELDKETNHLLTLQAEKNGRSKRAEALEIVKSNVHKKNINRIQCSFLNKDPTFGSFAL